MRTILFILTLMASMQSQAQKKASKDYPKQKVLVEVKSSLSLEQTFEYVVPMDLEHIFMRYKNIPAVDSTSNKEPWFKAGMKRTVYFDDGTSSEETLLKVVAPSGFSYKVNGFTNSLRVLIKQINGSWEFIEMEDKRIRIQWTYEFVPKHFIARFLINIIVKKRVEVAMTNALAIIKEELESGNLYLYERRVGNW